jgi:hypothetical protein
LFAALMVTNIPAGEHLRTERKHMSAEGTGVLTKERVEVDALYLFGCLTVWRKTGNLQAGWELIRALASSDPNIRSMAEALVYASGRRSRVPVLGGAA